MYKKVVYSIYVHKSNLKELERLIGQDDLESILKISKYLPEHFSYDIIKFDTKNRKVSFINSDKWDEEREPIVGDSYSTYLSNINLKLYRSRGQIYHHKWMFVSDDYKGFNIEESKKWSELWESKVAKNEKNKIGYRDKWHEILLKYNLPIN